MQSVWSGSIILASRWVPHAPTSTYDKLKPQRLLTEHWVSIIAEKETIKRRTAGSFRFLQTSTTVFALLLLESSHPAFQTQKPQKTGSLFFPSLLSAKFPTPLLPLILINLEALFILVYIFRSELNLTDVSWQFASINRMQMLLKWALQSVFELSPRKFCAQLHLEQK